MEQEIQNLRAELEDLKRQFYKNNFSNLFVYNTPVQFQRQIDFTLTPTGQKLIYVPVDNTALTGGITGRIKIDVGGNTRYIPYYTT